jgi:hypothetical protein
MDERNVKCEQNKIVAETEGKDSLGNWHLHGDNKSK